MSAPLSKHWPKDLLGAQKTDLRTQFAALCFKVKQGKLKFLLVTSRTRGRWIVPKGWPIFGQDAEEAVLTEAWEEAGVKGRISSRPVGLFSYVKEFDEKQDLPCVAMVYAVQVESLSDEFPEKDERERKWFSRKKAAKMVDDPELAQVIRDFDLSLMD